MALPIDPNLLSGLLLVAGLAIVIFIVWRLGKLIFGLISNTILGLLTLFLLNNFLGLGIPYDTPVLVVTAVFGMIGIAIIALLKFLGVTV